MEPEALRTLVLIVAIAALSPIVADVLRRWIRLPGVVLEIGLGMVIGPHVLGWAHLDHALEVLAEMGLVFLIFLAGFEIDPAEVKGRPLRLAATGWLASLAVGTGVAVVLHSLDVTSGIRFVAVALTTTAIGTLLPILGDAGVLRSPLGLHTMAGGALGEIGPIIAISLVLATDDPLRAALVLAGFAAVAAAAAWLASRPARPRLVELISRTFHTSGQLGVRISVLLCVVLVWVAEQFELDILLGAFAAGMVARLFLVGHGERAMGDADLADVDHRLEAQHRLEALGFGFFIPLFFVISGVRFDLESLADAGALAKVPVFLVCFLLARGLPALLLYRKELPPADVRRLALLQSAALPLVVVITGIGVAEGSLRSDNAAALVGAGLLSVIVFPLIALRGASAGASHDASLVA